MVEELTFRGRGETRNLRDEIRVRRSFASHVRGTTSHRRTKFKITKPTPTQNCYFPQGSLYDGNLRLCDWMDGWQEKGGAFPSTTTVSIHPHRGFIGSATKSGPDTPWSRSLEAPLRGQVWHLWVAIVTWVLKRSRQPDAWSFSPYAPRPRRR